MHQQRSHRRARPDLTERPLASLPRADATSLVRRLYAPDQRFARAFYRYWHTIIGQPEHVARDSTATELAQSADALLDNLDDSCVHTIGVEHAGGYEPIGMFAFRPLGDHAQGRILEQHVADTGLAARYPGPLAIGHAVAILDDHATREALETILLSIARKALAGGFAFVFFYTSDERLVPLYRHFGMDFPPDLHFPHSAHVVGVYEPARPINLRRMRIVAHRLGVPLESLAGA